MTAPFRIDLSRSLERARTGIAGLAALALVGLAAPALAATDVERVVSPGGIEAWLVSDDTVPLIALQFAFRGGATQDPEGKAGTATLTTALLDEGAGDLAEEAFKRRLEDTAARLSFDAGRDAVTGSLSTLSSRRDEAVDLLAKALDQPRFDEEPFERIRAQLISRQRSRSTDPETIASRLLISETFPGHPYATPVDGTAESLASIGVEDVRRYHEAVFARDNLVVGVVGDITAEELGPLLDRAFGALPRAADLKPVADVDPALGKSLTADVAEPQTLIRVATEGIDRQDPDYMAAFVLDHILGGGTFSSRLYREIRETRGLAYSVGTSLLSLDHAALYLAATGTRPETAEEALGLIREAFETMAAEGPTQAELEAAKRYLTGNYALRFDSSSKIAGQLVGLQLEDMPIDYFRVRNDLVEAVTLEDVNRVAKRLLGGPMTTVVVGPSSS